MDDYLDTIRSPGLYSLVSGDKDNEGRWQAFVDYSGSVENKSQDDKQRVALGLEADEYGIVKDIAFKLIRLRDFPGMSKLHELIRQYPKMLKDPHAKKEILALSHIDMPAPVVTNGKVEDGAWANKYRTEIIRQVKNSTART